jgi:hypothetical protein
MNHEPTQYDIDRLIEGRELIEGCRAVKSQCVKVLLDHDKMIADAAKKKDGQIERLDRDAVAITKSEAIIYRDDRLKEMHFDIDKFTKFNRDMVVAEVQWHMFKIIQVCDLCRGYAGTPPCRITCGNTSWNAKKPSSEIQLEKANEIFIKNDLFFQWIQQISFGKDGSITWDYSDLDTDSIAQKMGLNLRHEFKIDGVLHVKLGACPDGHGLISQYQAPARFDLHWTMDLMLEVPRLHDHLISIGK